MCMSSLQNQKIDIIFILFVNFFRYYFLKRKISSAQCQEAEHLVSVAVDLACVVQILGQHEHLSFSLSSSIKWEWLEGCWDWIR